MKRIFVCAALGLLVGAMGTHGEDKSGSPTNPYQIPDTITITVTRSAVPLRETASSITVITAKEIAASQATSVAELLRTVPSVDIVQSGATGGVTSAFVRGTNSNQTLVFVDGVKMNDPSSANGAFDFAHLQLDNVERIEVLRGPQSVLYGSDAIGGVIQIFTRHGFGKPQIEASSEAGTYDSYNGAISASGGAGPIGYAGSFSRKSVRGFSSTVVDADPLEPDGYKSSVGSAQVGVQIGEMSTLTVAGRYTDATADWDQAFGHWDDPNYTSNIRTGTVSTQWRYGSDGSRWMHQGGIRYLSSRIEANDDTDQYHPQDWIRSWSHATRLGLDWQSTHAFSGLLKLTLGAETQEERYSSDYQSGSAWGPYGSSVADRQARSTAVYGLQSVAVGKVLFSTVGVRWDHHERTGDVGTYRITTAFLIDEIGAKLKGTIGTGEKEPSLNDLYDPMFGNTELKPERSTGYEVGVEKTFMKEKLTFGATYFENHIRDLIRIQVRMENVAKAVTRGWEGTAELKSRLVTLNTEYTYTHAFDEADHSDLIRRPRHKGSVTATVKPVNRLATRAQVAFIGKREDNDFSTYPYSRLVLSSYTLVGVGATYDVSSLVHVHGRVENLLDRSYQEAYGYGAAGRGVYFGLSLSR